MTFEKAMYDSCKELGLDSHIKTIEYKKRLLYICRKNSL